VPWKFVEKLFFNNGLTSDLILLGKADKHIFFPEKNDIFVHSIIVCLKNCLPKKYCHNCEPSKHCWDPE